MILTHDMLLALKGLTDLLNDTEHQNANTTSDLERLKTDAQIGGYSTQQLMDMEDKLKKLSAT